MSPYYSDAGITIYCGDCREVLPHIGHVDVVITDPPYGINHPTNYASRGRGRIADCSDYPPVFDDDRPFDPTPWLRWPCIMWGANYYADKLPPVSGWLVWDKERPDTLDQSTCELAWSNFVKGVRRFRYLWNGCMRTGDEVLVHPTQKPEALMGWCMSLPWTPAGVVLDPYMGGGSTLVAAKLCGRKAIGVEVEESYCEIAANRLAQGVLFGSAAWEGEGRGNADR